MITFNLTKHLYLFDAIDMVRNAWYSVDTSVITNCWLKSTIAGYWNITKTAPVNKLNKLHEAQAIAHATSIFEDLDVHTWFKSFEESASMEEDAFRDELERGNMQTINQHMFITHSMDLSCSIPDFILSTDNECISTPHEVAYKE